MSKGSKFSICIANPPYDKSLHLKFLQKMIQISDEVVSIQPIRWLQDPKSKFIKSSAYNKYKETIVDRIYDLDIVSAAKSTELFNATITMDLGIYTCNNIGGWKNIFENKIVEKVIEKTSGIPTTIVKNVKKPVYCLITFIDGGHKERSNSKGSSYNIIRNEKWYGKYYIDGISTNGYTLEENKKRNKMATNGNPLTWPCVEFDTKQEAENFYEFTKTKFFKYIYKEEMVDVNVHPDKLPFMPTFTKHWNNDEIYEYYNLTNDEIEIIENFKLNE